MRRLLQATLAILVAAAAWALLFLAIESRVSTSMDPMACRMTYMWPDYIKMDDFNVSHTPMAVKYSLWLYKERGPFDDGSLLPHGTPVLFIPGNAGSSRQARSLGSVLTNMYHDLKKSRSADNLQHLDVFTVDTNEELTAFDSRILQEQIEYVNHAIRYIISLYSTHPTPPTSVIIVAHSMGGIVARNLFMTGSYSPGSVNTIITLATPHVHPPLTFERRMVDLFTRMNLYWSRRLKGEENTENNLKDVMLLSISGGNRDSLIDSGLAVIEDIIPKDHGFSVSSTGVPSVWASADHRCILWCNQLVILLSKLLYSIVDSSVASRTLPLTKRLEISKALLKYEFPHRLTSEFFARQPATLYLRETLNERKAVNSNVHFDTLSQPTLFALPKNEEFTLKLLVDASESLNDQMASVCQLNSSDTTTASCKSILSKFVKLPKQFPLSTDGAIDEVFHYLEVGSKDLVGFNSVLVKSSAPIWVSIVTESAAKPVSFSFIETLKGASTNVELDSVSTVLHIKDMKHSWFTYDVSLLPTCAVTGIKPRLGPTILQSINSGIEDKFHPSQNHFTIHFHENAPDGMHLRIWADPIGCKSYNFSIQINSRKSLGNVVRKVHSAWPSFVYAGVLLTLNGIISRWIRNDEANVSFRHQMSLDFKRTTPIALGCLLIWGIVQSALYNLAPGLDISKSFLGISHWSLAFVGPVLYVLALTVTAAVSLGASISVDVCARVLILLRAFKVAAFCSAILSDTITFLFLFLSSLLSPNLLAPILICLTFSQLVNMQVIDANPNNVTNIPKGYRALSKTLLHSTLILLLLHLPSEAPSLFVLGRDLWYGWIPGYTGNYPLDDSRLVLVLIAFTIICSAEHMPGRFYRMFGRNLMWVVVAVPMFAPVTQTYIGGIAIAAAYLIIILDFCSTGSTKRPDGEEGRIVAKASDDKKRE
ncbi:GPI inositol deacylase [Chytridiales sp. JEL 0842]|nr:GPI inositol deacylase [Chytridiales sp. JEL 0842]